MNEFDKRMRARARAEDCPIPAGFDGRLETLLEELPERQAARKPRRLRRTVVAAALAAALCVGGVAAASGVMELIARPGGFGGAAEGFQPYSAQVGASVTDRGYTLSLDGIGVDEAFITLYATITGEEPIPKDERGRPELWKLRLRAEGKDLEFWGQDQEIEWVDDYTLKVSQRCPVLRTLPEHRNGYAGTLFAAQERGYIGVGHSGRILPVDRSDDIAGHQTRFLCGRVPGHLNDLYALRRFLQRHANTDIPLQCRKALRIFLARQIHRMSVQQGEDVVNDLI